MALCINPGSSNYWKADIESLLQQDGSFRSLSHCDGCVQHSFYACDMSDRGIPVLHPRHKLEYFKKAGWSEEQRKDAHTVVHDKFQMCYKWRSKAWPNSGDKVRLSII